MNKGCKPPKSDLKLQESVNKVHVFLQFGVLHIPPTSNGIPELRTLSDFHPFFFGLTLRLQVL